MRYETALKKLAKKEYVMGLAKTIAITHEDGSIFVLRHAHPVGIGSKNWLGVKTEHHGDFLFFQPDIVSYRVL